MKILLDTNVLIWLLHDPAKIQPSTLKMLIDPVNELFVSHISLWEIVIKLQKGKLTQLGSSIHYVLDELREQRIDLLPLTVTHLFRLEYLDHLHNDPFDRLLIAQALSEDLPVATSDAVFRNYNIKVIW